MATGNWQSGSPAFALAVSCDKAYRLSIRKVVLILPSVTLLVFQRYSVDITIAVEKIGHSLVFHNLSAFNYETFDSPFANCLLISIFQVC